MRTGRLIGFLFVLFASKAAFAQQGFEVSDDSYNQAATTISDVLADESSSDHVTRQPPRGGGNYAWVFSYVDRSGGCQSCEFSCSAPRCSSDTVDLRKACKIPNTTDDYNVYTCVNLGRNFGR